MKVAILGGGITGLTAAYELARARRADSSIEYTLFEAGERLGGVIHTSRRDGFVIEAGPDSFLSEKPAAARLCAELGIAHRIVGSLDAQRKTHILVGDRLVPLPDGLMFLVPTRLIPTALTPLFSWKTKLRMGWEFLFPPPPASQDESVASLVERHFGPELVDRLASPLLAGVYGGDAYSLSARAVLPRLVEMEAAHRSLCRGMLAARRRRESSRPSGAAAPPSLFSTLQGGLQELVDALVAAIDPRVIHLRTRVYELALEDSLWTLRTQQGVGRYDALIVALPAQAAAGLLEPVHAGLGAHLRAIPYSSSITVSLGYTREQLAALPPGFGFLVPPSAGRHLRACTFVHNKFAHRAPQGMGLMRCFLGGAADNEIFTLGEQEIANLARAELLSILGITAQPRFIEIHRSRGGMAQYGVGHAERVAAIRATAAGLPNLALAGNAYDGIGISDCIRTGKDASAAILAASPVAAQHVGAR